MNKDEKEENFSYRYSAPTEDERREIESIRRTYLPDEGEGSNLARLRRLDAKVKRTASATALSIGVAGTLVFGLGLCMILQWSMMAAGVAVAVAGAAVAAVAHPVYTRLFRHLKLRYSDEILRLSDELLGEDRAARDDSAKGLRKQEKEEKDTLRAD